MKLYTLYRKIIEDLRIAGPLKKAWFTSFNLSPYFVENYIIPPLIGDPPCPVKNMGFEALYQKINKIGTDVRFFYDHRAIDLSESKKTAIMFYPIDLRSFQGQSGLSFQDGVFHPKVILLQAQDGRAWLVASSANLTVAGWSRNREAVLARQILSIDNWKRIVRFFNACAGKKIISEQDFTNKAGEDDWEFFHSLSGDLFLEKILKGITEKLFVWSPYFSDYLTNLIDKHIFPKMSEGASVGIIPDVKNNRIRLNTDLKEALQKNHSVKFYDDGHGSSVAEEHEMSHAKVWLTGSRLAVGSWNFTAAGMNIPNTKYSSNVEAGIIIPIKTKTFKALMPHTLLNIDRLEFMKKEEMDRDKEFLIKPLPFGIQVYRDWASDFYKISVKGKVTGGNFRVRLPGVDESVPIESSSKDKNVPFGKIAYALKEHIFTVFRCVKGKEEESYNGMIIDLFPENRPVWRFTSFNELLHSWAQDPEYSSDTERNIDWYELSYKDLIDHQYNADEIDDNTMVKYSDQTFSYYTMFTAFENIRNLISSEEMESTEKLKILLKTQPGSLFEISEKIRVIIEDNTTSIVYKWFLQEEINSLLRMLNSKIKRPGEKSLSNSINQKMVDEINEPALFNRFNESDRKWIQYIRNELNYKRLT